MSANRHFGDNVGHYVQWACDLSRGILSVYPFSESSDHVELFQTCDEITSKMPNSLESVACMWHILQVLRAGKCLVKKKLINSLICTSNKIDPKWKKRGIWTQNKRSLEIRLNISHNTPTCCASPTTNAALHFKFISYASYFLLCLKRYFLFPNLI